MIQRPIVGIIGIEESIRKTLTPSRLSSYLASPFTTATLVAGTPTKLLIPTTAKYARDFELDIPNSRWFLNSSGASGRQFTIAMTTSMSASVNNTDITVEMYKNGVKEPGVAMLRKIQTGGDVGQMAVVGSFELTHLDYIEVYVTSSLAGTITFSKTAINIMEVN